MVVRPTWLNSGGAGSAPRPSSTNSRPANAAGQPRPPQNGGPPQPKPKPKKAMNNPGPVQGQGPQGSSWLGNLFNGGPLGQMTKHTRRLLGF